MKHYTKKKAIANQEDFNQIHFLKKEGNLKNAQIAKITGWSAQIVGQWLKYKTFEDYTNYKKRVLTNKKAPKPVQVEEEQVLTNVMFNISEGLRENNKALWALVEAWNRKPER